MLYTLRSRRCWYSTAAGMRNVSKVRIYERCKARGDSTREIFQGRGEWPLGCVLAVAPLPQGAWGAKREDVPTTTPSYRKTLYHKIVRLAARHLLS